MHCVLRISRDTIYKGKKEKYISEVERSGRLSIECHHP